MTRSKKQIEARLADFEQACRDAGLKLTHQRLEIYRELIRSTDHPSAETLYRRLQRQMPTLSLDTVYRTLATFEERELIARVETVESQARFEVQLERHHHFICDRCHSIIDFVWETFDKGCARPSSLERLGRISSRNVIVRGVCNSCLAREKVAAEA
ncbi:MAG TPA: transcriptional repressor [Desulfobulbus sp.]|nr:transcriptional repressor [Desulfobulbus sp.]